MTDTIDPGIGTSAPDFKLSANNGSEISLADYRTKNNVYLFFVREFV